MVDLTPDNLQNLTPLNSQNDSSGFFLGPFLGAPVAVLLPEWLRVLQDYYLIVYALTVILLLLFCPTGLVGLFTRLLYRRAAPARTLADVRTP